MNRVSPGFCFFIAFVFACAAGILLVGAFYALRAHSLGHSLFGVCTAIVAILVAVGSVRHGKILRDAIREADKGEERKHGRS